jgi:hypothetical protein
MDRRPQYAILCQSQIFYAIYSVCLDKNIRDIIELNVKNTANGFLLPN